MASATATTCTAMSSAHNSNLSDEEAAAIVKALKPIATDGELTMRFILALWDSMTHCAEPESYHETTEKLQEALDYEASAAKVQTPLPPPKASSEPLSAKTSDWEGYKVYQIQLDSSGNPIPDPEWPGTARFLQGTTKEGKPFFQLFETKDQARIIDTTDPSRDEMAIPELKDDSYLVYKLGRKYRSGPAVYGADGKITSQPFNPGLTFDFAEHAFMGNKVKLALPGQPDKQAGIRFLLNANGLALTYGEINALAGDFFGTFKPILRGKDFNEQCDLFKKAWATLGDAPGGTIAANKIKAIMKDEWDQLGEATDFGNKTADTLALYRKMTASQKALADEDKNLNEATHGIGMPSYLALAQLNLDHFGWGAITAYNAGHYCAMEEARQGNVTRGYIMNAFADHFLGDCFSSGHFRTPRAQLHGGDDGVQDAIDRIVAIVGGNTKLEMAGAVALQILDPRSSLIATLKQLAPDLCAKYMHDEDNIRGLWLNNARGDEWQAFGDAKLFTDQNKTNAEFMRQALQLSADEIWKAYTEYKDKAIPHPDSDDAGDLYQAWNIAPTAERPGNHQPLFAPNGDRRDPWTDPNAQGRSKPGWLVPSYILWAVDFVRSDYFDKLK